MRFTGSSTAVHKRAAVLISLLMVIASLHIGLQAGVAAETSRTIFTTVSSGEHFSCALTDKGIVYCWGANDRSQLGTSDRARNLIPNKVYELSNVVEIATGRDFACARISDGGVRCWGRGDLGQTGDGGETNNDRIFASVIPNINSAIGLVAGQSHACALLEDKSVVCWGENQFWQLGNALSTFERVPIVVSGIPEAIQISSGINHVCVLAESGFSYCWGDNRFGQLGIGNKSVFKNLPSVVLGITKVKTLQLGADTSCAITSTPAVKCWGWGQDGQILGADIGNQYFPQDTSLGNLVIVAPGRTKACGIFNTENSSLLYCWAKEIGAYPATGPAAISVSLGYDHGCAVTSLGFIQCFGWNHKGQLGTGTTSIANSKIVSVSAISFPDWLYWIQSWSIKYEDELGILTWVGGLPRYTVHVEGFGIVCQDLLIASCKFGPLTSNKTYNGTITALNTGSTNFLVGYSGFSFSTKEITTALNQYAIDQAAAKEKAAKAEKEKADLQKANLFIDAISKRIDETNVLIDKANANLEAQNLKQLKEIENFETSSKEIAVQRQEIRKVMASIEAIVKSIVKKIGN
jgi:alpha-tubulin suppressor-like RCC1 family protein